MGRHSNVYISKMIATRLCLLFPLLQFIYSRRMFFKLPEDQSIYTQFPSIVQQSRLCNLRDSRPLLPSREKALNHHEHTLRSKVLSWPRHQGWQTRNHLDLAADFLVHIFDANHVPYAFMGGYSLALRGSLRGTYDVDLTIGCDMDQLVQIIKAQNGVWRPLGPTSGVLRLFVLVGGGTYRVPELRVMVDVILRGSLGAPDNLQTASEVINSTTALGPRAWSALNLLTVMNSKLGAFFARGGGNAESNDYKDIVFLMNNYMEPIYNIRSQLNATHRHEFVNTYARVNQGPQKMVQVKKIKHVLGIA